MIAPLKLLQKLPDGALAFVVPGEFDPEEFPTHAQAFANKIGASAQPLDDRSWVLYRDRHTYSLTYHDYPRQMLLRSLDDHGNTFLRELAKEARGSDT